MTGFELDGSGVSVTLDRGARIAAAALIGADGVYSNVRKRIVGDGDPLPAGAIIFRATIPAAEMPKDLQKPYPTFWGGPELAHDLLPDQRLDHVQPRLHGGDRAKPELSEAEEFAPDAVLPYFVDRCEIPDRVLRIPKSFRRYIIVHREPVENWTMGPATLLGDAAHPMVQYIAQGAAMALEDAICLAGAARRMRRRFRARVPALPGHPHRADRAGADFLDDDEQAQPRQGRRAKGAQFAVRGPHAGGILRSPGVALHRRRHTCK